MRHACVLLIVVLVSCAMSADDAIAGCPRTVVIRAHSSTDPSFTAQVALQQLGALLQRQSPNIRIVEQAEKPEYVVAVTFERRPPDVEIGISLGAVDGRIPGASSKGFPLRTYYYGYLLAIFGRGARGDKPADLIPYLEEDLAGLGGLERVMREYEQIPVGAAAERDVKCIEHGETREIKLFEFKTDYPQTTAYSATARLVVFAEKGTILTGTPVAGDPRYRVLTLGTAPRAQDRTWVKYQAPADSNLAADTLLVYNACEILPADVSPLEQTQRQAQILELQIPLCGDLQLEYDHRLVQSFGGARMEGRTTGMVPIRFKDREGRVIEYGSTPQVAGPFTLEGRGTVTMKMQGSLPGGCTASYSTTMDASLSGTATYKGRGARIVLVLTVKVAESWSKTPTPMTLVCPDRAQTIEWSIPAPVLNWTNPLEFECRDGAEVQQPFLGAFGSGTYRWILRVPQR